MCSQCYHIPHRRSVLKETETNRELLFLFCLLVISLFLFLFLCFADNCRFHFSKISRMYIARHLVGDILDRRLLQNNFNELII